MELYDPSGARLRLKVRMLKAEVVDFNLWMLRAKVVETAVREHHVEPVQGSLRRAAAGPPPVDASDGGKESATVPPYPTSTR